MTSDRPEPISRRWAPPWAVRLLVESVVVVFSVLVALAVDEWRENRGLERQVEETRVAFAEEIQGNQALLQAEFGVRFHNELWGLYRQLYSAMHQPGQARQVDSLQQVVMARMNNGVRPPPLRDAVWRSVAQSDLVRHMEPEEVFLIADIYQEQEQLRLAFRRMLDVWLQPIPYRNDPAYQRDDTNVTRIFLADVVAAEERLLERYQEGLSLLRK